MLEAEMGDREASQDTEITRGTGTLLGIFFGLVFVCGAFFTLGYMLGHNVGSAGASTQIIGATTPPGSSTGKPSAKNKSSEAVPTYPPGSPNSPPTPNQPSSPVFQSGASKR